MSHRSGVARYTLKNKKILITAGPTWVPIDKVRIISNIATGETGTLLADKLQALGAEVTLLLGPADSRRVNKNIKLIRFRFFDELRHSIIKELTSKKYDMVIHSAAVADYKPKDFFKEKIQSGIKELRLILVPTSKIINLIKKINPSLFVVGFKFETRRTKKIMIREAGKLIQQANLDLVVANAISKNKYLAYIVDNCSRICGPIYTKKNMVTKLINMIRGVPEVNF